MGVAFQFSRRLLLERLLSPLKGLGTPVEGQWTVVVGFISGLPSAPPVRVSAPQLCLLWLRQKLCHQEVGVPPLCSSFSKLFALRVPRVSAKVFGSLPGLLASCLARLGPEPVP